MDPRRSTHSHRTPCLGLLALALCVAGLPAAAIARDGVLEINQACATSTGCFPGDAPGFPVEVTAAAGATSLRLTSALVLPNVFATGIVVTTEDVTIDLAGFDVILADCVATLDRNCAATATGSTGIFAEGALGLTLRNGGIVGMGGDGVRAGDWAQVENLHVRWSRGAGLRLGRGARVRRVTSERNDGDGAVVGEGALVSDSGFSSNGGHGLVATAGAATLRGLDARGNGLSGILAADSVIRTSVATTNGSSGAGAPNSEAGISCLGRCVLEGNRADSNLRDGIECGSECVIGDNFASFNDDDGLSCSTACDVDRNFAANNTTDGIRAPRGSRVRGNVASGNGDDGLQLGSSVAYADNVLNGNLGLPVDGVSGTDLGGNLCDGAVCP